MKKICIFILIVLSFSLVSCGTVKLDKYKNEVEKEYFRNQFDTEYKKFYKKLIDEDFEYKCTYVIKQNPTIINKTIDLTSTFKQDLDSQVYVFTEKGIENDAMTNYETVNVNTNDTYYYENNQCYLKDKNDKISKIDMNCYIFERGCRIAFIDNMSFHLYDGHYYVDDNIYTKEIYTESLGTLGTIFNELTQVIFEEDKVTFWSYEKRTTNEQIYICEIKMTFIFKVIKLKKN